MIVVIDGEGDFMVGISRLNSADCRPRTSWGVLVAGCGSL